MMTTVGIKSGCFTLLHAGHVWCINECAKHCQHLIVLTNDDDYIKRKKGNVPVSLKDRLYILDNLNKVSETSFFSEDNEDTWIKDFKERRLYQEFGIDASLIVFHSDELQGSLWVPGQEYADQIIFIPKVARTESVTKIYEDIKK